MFLCVKLLKLPILHNVNRTFLVTYFCSYVFCLHKSIQLLLMNSLYLKPPKNRSKPLPYGEFLFTKLMI